MAIAYEKGPEIITKGTQLSPYDLYPSPHDSRIHDGSELEVFLADGEEITKVDGAEIVEGLSYVSNYEFTQGSNYHKSLAAHRIATGLAGYPNTVDFFETFLQQYYEDPAIELKHIKSQAMSASGFPGLVFGFSRETVQTKL